MDSKSEKIENVKTNNQELLIRRQNGSDATSKWIDIKYEYKWQ